MRNCRALAVVDLLCEECQKPFSVNGAQAKSYAARSGKTRRYCSFPCYNKARLIEVPTYECAHCHTVRERRKYQSGSYDYSTRFCSRACVDAAQTKGCVDKNGYMLRRRNGRMVPEHRIVMEELIGRPLTRQENVHHINGQKLDNRSENLEIWNCSQPSGQRAKDKVSFALEILSLYPELLKEAGYKVVPDISDDTRDVRESPPNKPEYMMGEASLSSTAGSGG